MGRTRRSARKRTYLKRKHSRRSVQKMSRNRTRKRRNTRRATKRIKKRGGMLRGRAIGPPKKLTPEEFQIKLRLALDGVRKCGSTPWGNYKEAGNPPKESMPPWLMVNPEDIMNFSKLKTVKDALERVNVWERIFIKDLTECERGDDTNYNTLMRQKEALLKKQSEFGEEEPLLSSEAEQALYRTWLEDFSGL